MLRPILAAFVVAFLWVSTAVADVTVPHLTTRVYDETSTLSPDQVETLSRKLAIYEDSTSTQIVVAIVKTLGGAEINEYAVTLGKENHIGQAKKNNGLIVLIAINERKSYIATGYGMEATITDALCSQITREVLNPRLKSGDFYGGIDATIDSIVAAAKGEFKGSGSHRGRGNDGNGGGAFVIVGIIFLIIVIVQAMIGRGLRRTVIGSQGANHGFMSGFLSALFWSSIFRGGGRRGSGSDWGGFGGGGGSDGGGFSGFSGGGGDFGGGGAGGDW